MCTLVEKMFLHGNLAIKLGLYLLGRVMFFGALVLSLVSLIFSMNKKKRQELESSQEFVLQEFNV